MKKIKLNYCVISVPPALGGAEINRVNVVGKTLCSKSFTYDSLVLVILVIHLVTEAGHFVE